MFFNGFSWEYFSLCIRNTSNFYVFYTRSNLEQSVVYENKMSFLFFFILSLVFTHLILFYDVYRSACFFFSCSSLVFLVDQHKNGNHLCKKVFRSCRYPIYLQHYLCRWFGDWALLWIRKLLFVLPLLVNARITVSLLLWV